MATATTFSRAPLAAVAVVLAVLSCAAAVPAAAADDGCFRLPSFAPAPTSQTYYGGQDVGLHRAAYETDWYVGYLDDVDSDRTFGVMLVLVSVGKDKTGHCVLDRPALGSVAVSDVANNRFLQGYGIAPTAATVGPSLAFRAGVWSLKQNGPDWRHARMAASLPNTPGGAVQLSLQTTARGPILGMASDGVLVSNQTVPSQGMGHIAQSNLTASGTIEVGGESFNVTGSLWVQHMFGSMTTTRGFTWHWFYVRLSDGWSLQLTQFDDVGRGNAAYSYMNLVPPSASLGDAEEARATMYAPQPEYGWTVEGARPWKSPVTGAVYNTTNRIRCDAFGLDVEVTARILDNEVVIPGLHFYEGASTVTGTHLGRPVTGDAFTERVLPATLPEWFRKY